MRSLSSFTSLFLVCVYFTSCSAEENWSNSDISTGLGESILPEVGGSVGLETNSSDSGESVTQDDLNQQGVSPGDENSGAYESDEGTSNLASVQSKSLILPESDSYTEKEIVRKVRSMVMKGEIDEKTSAELEVYLQGHPEDLPSRYAVMSYYFQMLAYKFDDSLLRSYADHVLYFIEHHPESPYAGSTEAMLIIIRDPDAFNRAKEAWLKHINPEDTDIRILANAAKSLGFRDSELAEGLYKRCLAQEPENLEWYEELGHLYALRSIRSGKVDAIKSLDMYEVVLASASTSDRLRNLEPAASAACDAGELDKAEAYAQELLDAVELMDESDKGDAIHNGNIILGRVALVRGDAEAAKSYLKKGGSTNGSPVLDSFGPDFKLAADLLEVGEKDAVLEYLKQVATFWDGKEDVLERWTDEIENGQSPDFNRTWD